MMNSLEVGKNILDVEVSHISAHGIWLLTENQEFFMPYEEFPWFQDAVDLTIEMIKNPHRFPLRNQMS